MFTCREASASLLFGKKKTREPCITYHRNSKKSVTDQKLTDRRKRKSSMKSIILIFALLPFIAGYAQARSQGSANTTKQVDLAETSDFPVWVSVQHSQDEADSVSSNLSKPEFDDRAIRIQQRTVSDAPVMPGYENITREYLIQTDNWYYLYRKIQQDNELHYFGYNHFEGEELPDMTALIQTGVFNRALILQFHNQHNIKFGQEGVDNRILISQTDTLSSGNNTANVQQRGSGNRAAIIQNR